MEEIINYLRLKNQYFQKFFETTQKFLRCSEDEQWKDIEFFVDNRERILSIIRYFDCKIGFLSGSISDRDVELYRGEVKRLLEERESIAKRIVNLDLNLISRIEELKSETIGELKKILETRQQLNSFSLSAEPLRVRKTSKSA